MLTKLEIENFCAKIPLGWISYTNWQCFCLSLSELGFFYHIENPLYFFESFCCSPSLVFEHIKILICQNLVSFVCDELWPWWIACPSILLYMEEEMLNKGISWEFLYIALFLCKNWMNYYGVSLFSVRLCVSNDSGQPNEWWSWLLNLMAGSIWCCIGRRNCSISWS